MLDKHLQLVTAIICVGLAICPQTCLCYLTPKNTLKYYVVPACVGCWKFWIMILYICPAFFSEVADTSPPVVIASKNDVYDELYDDIQEESCKWCHIQLLSNNLVKWILPLMLVKYLKYYLLSTMLCYWILDLCCAVSSRIEEGQATIMILCLCFQWIALISMVASSLTCYLRYVLVWISPR